MIDASTANRVADGWVYGFPELSKAHRAKLLASKRISNPGCYPTGAIAILRPLIDALLGRPPTDISEPAVLAVDVPANDGREDYVRATMVVAAGLPSVTPLPVQDSSMLAVLAAADCLLIRAPGAPAGKAGDACRIIRLN